MKNSLFKDKNGNISSKRIFGGILIVLGFSIYFGFRDSQMAMTCLGAGSALLGLGAFER